MKVKIENENHVFDTPFKSIDGFIDFYCKHELIPIIAEEVYPYGLVPKHAIQIIWEEDE